MGASWGMELVIDPFFELFSALEKRQPFGGDLNLFSGFGVSAHIAFVFLDVKAAKPPDFNPLSFDKRIGKRIEKDVYHFRRFSFGQARPVF
jgi:hypothetical protein